MTIADPSYATHGPLARAAAQWKMAAEGESTDLAYNPQHFYTQAHDYRGHGEKASFSVPPDLWAMVMKLVTDDTFPQYTMPGDVFRDAVMHLLVKRREQLEDPTFRESLARLQRDYAFHRQVKLAADEADRWQQSCDFLNRMMTTLMKSRAWDQMETSLHNTETQTQTMAEPYASQMIELIKDWRGKIPER